MTMREETLEFAIIMARHLPAVNHSYLRDTLNELMSCSTHAKRYAEYVCNRGLTDREEQADQRNDDRIRYLARSIGCGVEISGDPRGCAVKLVLPDGYTNDFAHEGVCVPTA